MKIKLLQNCLDGVTGEGLKKGQVIEVEELRGLQAIADHNAEEVKETKKVSTEK